MQTLPKFLMMGALLAMPSVSFAQDSRPADEKAHEVTWIADFDEAQALAKAQNKDMLVDFTGSDWCIWCKRLHDEVFSKPEFQAFATENFILVSLDYPNDPAIKAKVPNPERNAELATLYGIEGYPTVLLMTPDGEVFGRTGYQPDGPEAYNASLAKMLATGKVELNQVKKLVKEWEAVTDANRVDTYKRILATFQGYEADSIGAGALAPVIAAALTFDADNALGLKLEATKTLLTAGKTDAALMSSALELDPKNELGLFERVVVAEFNSAAGIEDAADAAAHLVEVDKLGIQDADVAMELYFYGALFNWRYLENKADARMFALKLEALNPDNPNAVRLLEDLFGEIGREAGEDHDEAGEDNDGDDGQGDDDGDDD
jgi:thioredoxin-related protein